MDIDLYVFLDRFEEKGIFDFLDCFLIEYTPNPNVVYFEYFSESSNYDDVEYETDNLYEMLNYVLSSNKRKFIFDFKSTLNGRFGIIHIYPNRNLGMGLSLRNEEEIDKYINILKEKYKTNDLFVCYFSHAPSYVNDVKKLIESQNL